MVFISAILLLVTAALLWVVLVFAIEVFLGLLTTPVRSAGARLRGRVAVLVPAHNEGSGLKLTLSDLQAQLSENDRLLVVADNCTDDTAAVARAAGAEVVERNEPKLRGKGYALDFGARHLHSRPPDTLIIIDADCRLLPAAIDELACLSGSTGRPAQAEYLMKAPQESSLGLRVAEFAWRVKNHVRPLGLSSLNLGCQMVGTGMAIPWNLISLVSLANSALAEDLELGLELAGTGHSPVFCPSAQIWSEFPLSAAGERSQRARWEQGHLYAIWTLFLPTLSSALRRRDLAAAALAFDLLVLPVSLLAMLIMSSALLTAGWMLLSGSSGPLYLCLFSLIIFVSAVGLAWWRVGSDIVPARQLWAVLPFAARKLGIYLKVFSGKMDRNWVRTDRER